MKFYSLTTLFLLSIRILLASSSTPLCCSAATDLSDTIPSKYTMGEFIGTNSFIDSPIDKLSAVGWTREYHPWSWNEIENDVFEYNRWNGFWDFDQFYSDLKAQGVMICPVLWSSPEWLQPKGNDRPVVNSEDPFLPNSYREIAEFMYQFAGRYGAVKVADTSLMVNEGQLKKSGLGLISYYEDWNEQDKDWEGEAAEFKPGQYAAMASANIDGHCGTMGPHYGIKQADPNAKFVMGGLAGIETKYLKDMKSWFVNNRPDSAWPIDVINVHHYAFVRDVAGVSPEKDFFKQKIANVVKWKDMNAPESEVWLTEFGYDSNPYSMNQAPEIGNFTQEEVQAIWNLRTFLILASTGVDRAAHFMIRDTDPGSGYRYGDSGLLTSKAEGHVPKVSWYYLQTMYSILQDLHFTEIIAEDAAIWNYKFSNLSGDTAAYACWSPTSDGSSSIYLFKADVHTDSVKVTRLKDNSTRGISEYYKYDSAGLELSIGESPVFIEAIKDSTVTIIDTTDIISLKHQHLPDIHIFPNPADTEMTISYQSIPDFEGPVSISIYNTSGILLSKYDIELSDREGIFRINTKHLIEGSYLLILKGINTSCSRSFIIQRR